MAKQKFTTNLSAETIEQIEFIGKRWAERGSGYAEDVQDKQHGGISKAKVIALAIEDLFDRLQTSDDVSLPE